jgi:short-subunit dehydrogenase
MVQALITGGSSGLGYELSKLLLEDFDITNLSRTVSDLKVKNIKIDLGDSKKLKKTISKLSSEDFSLLILNAGSLHWRRIGEIPYEEIDTEFKINITSMIKITNGIINQIIKNRGTIIIIGSTAAYNTHDGGSVYTSSKYAVKGFVKALQHDLKNSDIRILGLHPGGFKSELHKRGGLKRSDKIRPSSKDIANKVYKIYKSKIKFTNKII